MAPARNYLLLYAAKDSKVQNSRGFFQVSRTAPTRAKALAPVFAESLTMPAEPTQARRFGMARAARSATLVEDYVELIADLIAAHGEARATEVAKRLGVTHPTALKAISRLKRDGLATSRPYRGIFLTETGQAMAEKVRARHRLIVELLTAVGVPQEAAEADAEGMEHHASEATLKAFERFLAGKTTES